MKNPILLHPQFDQFLDCTRTVECNRETLEMLLNQHTEKRFFRFSDWKKGQPDAIATIDTDEKQIMVFNDTDQTGFTLTRYEGDPWKNLFVISSSIHENGAHYCWSCASATVINKAIKRFFRRCNERSQYRLF